MEAKLGQESGKDRESFSPTSKATTTTSTTYHSTNQERLVEVDVRVDARFTHGMAEEGRAFLLVYRSPRQSSPLDTASNSNNIITNIDIINLR